MTWSAVGSGSERHRHTEAEGGGPRQALTMSGSLWTVAPSVTSFVVVVRTTPSTAHEPHASHRSLAVLLCWVHLALRWTVVAGGWQKSPCSPPCSGERRPGGHSDSGLSRLWCLLCWVLIVASRLRSRAFLCCRVRWTPGPWGVCAQTHSASS
jgi:hypothetical protein